MKLHTHLNFADNREAAFRIGQREGKIILALFIVVASACDKSLPSAPSELTEGVVIYEDANYRGRSALVTHDIADLKDFHGPCLTSDPSPSGGIGESNWNDCISSVRVAPGWRATLFGDDGYRGSQLEVTADVPDLKLVPGRCASGMDDCVTSIRIGRVQ
jgi:peptidase inhibitor family I36